MDSAIAFQPFVEEGDGREVRIEVRGDAAAPATSRLLTMPERLMLGLLLPYLEPASGLAAFAQSCRRARALVAHEELWQRLLARDFAPLPEPAAMELIQALVAFAEQPPRAEPLRALVERRYASVRALEMLLTQLMLALFGHLVARRLGQLNKAPPRDWAAFVAQLGSPPARASTRPTTACTRLVELRETDWGSWGSWGSRGVPRPLTTPATVEQTLDAALALLGDKPLGTQRLLVVAPHEICARAEYAARIRIGCELTTEADLAALQAAYTQTVRPLAAHKLGYSALLLTTLLLACLRGNATLRLAGGVPGLSWSAVFAPFWAATVASLVAVVHIHCLGRRLCRPSEPKSRAAELRIGFAQAAEAADKGLRLASLAGRAETLLFSALLVAALEAAVFPWLPALFYVVVFGLTLLKHAVALARTRAPEHAFLVVLWLGTLCCPLFIALRLAGTIAWAWSVVLVPALVGGLVCALLGLVILLGGENRRDRALGLALLSGVTTLGLAVAQLELCDRGRAPLNLFVLLAAAAPALAYNCWGAWPGPAQAAVARLAQQQLTVRGVPHVLAGVTALTEGDDSPLTLTNFDTLVQLEHTRLCARLRELGLACPVCAAAAPPRPWREAVEADAAVYATVEAAADAQAASEPSYVAAPHRFSFLAASGSRRLLSDEPTVANSSSGATLSPRRREANLLQRHVLVWKLLHAREPASLDG